MINRLRSTIGGLAASAVMAGSALGGTNDAVISSYVSTNSPVYVGGKRIVIGVTNLQQKVTSRLERSTNLVNGVWTKVGSNYSVQSSPTNCVFKTIDMSPTDPYFNQSFFRVYGVGQ
jgi:hypothetical protein